MSVEEGRNGCNVCATKFCKNLPCIRNGIARAKVRLCATCRADFSCIKASGFQDRSLSVSARGIDVLPEFPSVCFCFRELIQRHPVVWRRRGRQLLVSNVVVVIGVIVVIIVFVVGSPAGRECGWECVCCGMRVMRRVFECSVFLKGSVLFLFFFFLNG